MTTIKCAYAGAGTTVTIGVIPGYDEPRMFVRANAGADVIVANPTQAEFIRAVETELNVKIIDRADLPEAYIGDTEADFVYGEQGHTEPIPKGMSGDELIALGLALKARQSVDEAAVDALRHLMADAGKYFSVESVPVEFARRLVQAGVRPPKAD